MYGYGQSPTLAQPSVVSMANGDTASVLTSVDMVSVMCTHVCGVCGVCVCVCVCAHMNTLLLEWP